MNTNSSPAKFRFDIANTRISLLWCKIRTAFCNESCWNKDKVSLALSMCKFTILLAIVIIESWLLNGKLESILQKWLFK